MPTLAYGGFYFSHGIRNFRRNILRFSGIDPVRLTYLGGVDHAKPKTVSKWFNKMRMLGSFPVEDRDPYLP